MKWMKWNAMVLGVMLVVGLALSSTANADTTTIRGNVALFQPVYVESGTWTGDLSVMTDDTQGTRVSTTDTLSGLWVDLQQEYTLEKLYLGRKNNANVAGALLRAFAADQFTEVGTPITIPTGGESTYTYYPTDWMGVQWIMISDEGAAPAAMTDTLRELRAYAQVPIYDQFIPYVVATASQTYAGAPDLVPNAMCNNGGMTDQRTLIGDPGALSIPSGPFWQTQDETSGWVEFDLHAVYDLDQMCIWNLNQINHAIRGIQHATIEYSLDDVTYTELADTNGEDAGNYTIPIVTENVQNACSLSIDLDAMNIEAQYIRITAIDNWGDTVNLGLSEVRFYGELPNPTPIPGDTEPDGDVDAEDLAVLAGNWGAPAAANDYTVGNFNDDTVVDMRDAAILAAHWTGPGEASPTAVPEPLAGTLLASLALAVGVLRPRRTAR